MLSSRMLNTILLCCFWILHFNIVASEEPSKYCPPKEHKFASPCKSTCSNDSDCTELDAVCCPGGCVNEVEYLETGKTEYYTVCIRRDMCNLGVCQNGALCVHDFLTGYKCRCTPGFAGTNCSVNINECLSNPCQCGGECQDLVNGYRCCCPYGRCGQNCEYECTNPHYFENTCNSKTCKKYPDAKFTMKPTFVIEREGKKVDVTDECDDTT